MDRHELAGASIADVTAAHLMDLEVQERFGVEYLNYWFDFERQRAFCLARGPDEETVGAVHRAGHGLLASEIIEVDESAVGRFLGSFKEPGAKQAEPQTAFRAIMFTDLEGSTRLTQQLGDTGAMAVLHEHDGIVRRALAQTEGSEVKHTGDGIMASFGTANSAVAASVAIQRALAEAEAAGRMPAGVRIGVAAGEPVAEADDLFGAAVQMAARLCSRAGSRSILVSSAVRDLVSDSDFRFGTAKVIRLKGFDEPIRASKVLW